MIEQTDAGQFSMKKSYSTSREVFDAYVDRSWRSNALRQRNKGVEFVIGGRENAYLWNLEGTKRIIDCGTAGGVHSLGHRNPEIVATLRQAIDDSRDSGLWAIPNAEYLKLQDALSRVAPSPHLTKSLVTHCSTLSIDVATMFAFRVTRRQKILAYRHGYHGHSGFAAMVTGSFEEGIHDYYHLPTPYAAFLPEYGDVDAVAALLQDDIAALLIEPIDYETFAAAPANFLGAVGELCRERGALFILDETRTGLGRTGKLWAAEHLGAQPDMLITGKGLSGGLYPVSAVQMRAEIYERCINEHPFSYISSLGGNEIACMVAQKVLEVSSRENFLSHANKIGGKLSDRLKALAAKHGNILSEGTTFGCIATLGINDPALAPALYRAAFEEGVLCHSISVTEPCVLKLLPPLTIDDNIVDEIYEAIERAVVRVAG